ncbi:hypothetical protein CYMTET_41748 [Cymbomonas tetramitiformis]|uniref:Uncharacterized protein n=1 Tax=Cymbomonas tetramitiformis TaxID=36881 RepID=A0AAE0F276_9CHLO|nr:hypothetical protein CYMTET_41748 [Cymbomonas tetramitiformis]
MGSGEQHFVQYESSEDHESESPPGYFDDSCSYEEEELAYEGHLAAMYFSPDRLEQDETLDTGFLGDAYGCVLEPPLGEGFLPRSEFNVGAFSFVDQPAVDNEDVYSAEEWAA